MLHESVEWIAHQLPPAVDHHTPPGGPMRSHPRTNQSGAGRRISIVAYHKPRADICMRLLCGIWLGTDQVRK